MSLLYSHSLPPRARAGDPRQPSCLAALHPPRARHVRRRAQHAGPGPAPLPLAQNDLVEINLSTLVRWEHARMPPSSVQLRERSRLWPWLLRASLNASFPPWCAPPTHPPRAGGERRRGWRGRARGAPPRATRGPGGVGGVRPCAGARGAHGRRPRQREAGPALRPKPETSPPLPPESAGGAPRVAAAVQLRLVPPRDQQSPVKTVSKGF